MRGQHSIFLRTVPTWQTQERLILWIITAPGRSATVSDSVSTPETLQISSPLHLVSEIKSPLVWPSQPSAAPINIKCFSADHALIRYVAQVLLLQRDPAVFTEPHVQGLINFLLLSEDVFNSLRCDTDGVALRDSTGVRAAPAPSSMLGIGAAPPLCCNKVKAFPRQRPHDSCEYPSLLP